MIGLPLDMWARLVIWWAIGFVIYVAYGRSHSTLTTKAIAATKVKAR